MTRILFRATCFWLLLLLHCANAAPRIPISVPIRFGVDTYVEFSADITRHRNYYLDVVFSSRNQQQREFVRKVVGEPEISCRALNECGEISSFKVTIKQRDQTVLQAQKDAVGRYAYGAFEFYRNILITALRPGPTYY